MSLPYILLSCVESDNRSKITTNAANGGSETDLKRVEERREKDWKAEMTYRLREGVSYISFANKNINSVNVQGVQ